MSEQEQGAPSLDFNHIAFLAFSIVGAAEELPEYWDKTDDTQPHAVEAMTEGMRSWLLQIWGELRDATKCNEANLQNPPGLIARPEPNEKEPESFFEDSLGCLSEVELAPLERKGAPAVRLDELTKPLTEIVEIAQDLNDHWQALSCAQRKERLDRALRLQDTTAEILHSF